MRRAEQRVRRDAGQHCRDDDVEDRADDERAEDADRHVALRILRFLRRGRDRIEADVREEHDRRRTEHARPAEVACIVHRRHERMPVRRVDELQRERDEEQDHDELDRDDDRVQRRRLRDADVADPADRADDQHGRQIDERAGRRYVAVGHRQRRIRYGGRQRELHAGELADRAEQAVEVARPADRDGRGREEVFEDQHPADEPGDDLAERRVRIRVRAARNRQHRGELGVAQARERAGDAGEDEAQHDGGAGMHRGGLAGQHEDAGADDRADAEHDEVLGGQCALERNLAGDRALRVLAGVDVRRRMHRLDRENIFQHRVPLSKGSESVRPGRVGFAGSGKGRPNFLPERRCISAPCTTRPRVAGSPTRSKEARVLGDRGECAARRRANLTHAPGRAQAALRLELPRRDGADYACRRHGRPTPPARRRARRVPPRLSRSGRDRRRVRALPALGAERVRSRRISSGISPDRPGSSAATGRACC